MSSVSLRFSLSKRLFLFTALLILCLGRGAPVHAAGITVNATCSLADAITAANTDTATGSCPAGSGADTITLTANVLMDGALANITSEITLEGGGFTIDANRKSRIFNVSSSGDLTVNNVALINGRVAAPQDGGAGIITYGRLTVKNTLFKGHDSHRQGGGIRVNRSGTAVIVNSTFTNNRATKGAAVYSAGTLVKITNSTIAYNHTAGWHTLRALMTSPDSGFRAKIELYNNIIVGHTSGNGCYIHFPDGLRTESAYNVNNYSDTARCYAALGPDDGPINLGALTGSPGYFPLLGGSAALGAGASAHCPATDQVGASRPNPTGSNCDLGAKEASDSPATLTPSPIASATTDSGQQSEQDATETPSPTPTTTATRESGGIPVNLNSTVSVKGVMLNWEAPTVVPDGYLVRRRLQGEQEYEELSHIFAVEVADPTTYLDDTVTAAGTYEYTVQSIFTDGSSYEPSDPVTVTVDEADLATGTPTKTQTPSQTDTMTPTATYSAMPTATPTPSQTPTNAPRQGCVNVGPDTYWLFPSSNYLSGNIAVYASDQCVLARATTQQIGAHGYVHTADGLAMAGAICNAAHGVGAYTAQQQAFNTNLWACQLLPPTATDTAIPPVATNTAIATDTAVPPTATNTAIPATSADSRAIGAVRASSTEAGELTVSWIPPRETTRDYRIRWAKVDEAFRSWDDLDYNAFPTDPTYTIVGLETGERYKIEVRARFAQGSGPWAPEVRADVMALVSLKQVEAVVLPNDTATPTNTPINTPTNTATATNTAISSSATPTNTATNTAIPASDTPTATPTQTPTDTPTHTAVPPSETPAPQVDPREIGSVLLQGDPNGSLTVTWQPPREAPYDYRVNWARDGEEFPSWRDEAANGFPTVNTYTITGLDVDVCYKIRLRARYNGSAGDWIEVKGKISSTC